MTRKYNREPSVTVRRDALERPHAAQHEASLRVVMRQAAPKGLGQLVSWFLREWAAETPTAIHVNDVWRDWTSVTEDRHAEGGSLLGTPKWHDDFRRYVEGSPHSTDPDGHYDRPLRSALARLCGKGGHEGATHRLGESPFMARFLFLYGNSGGQLTAVAESMGIPPQVAQIYAERALMKVYRAFAETPDTWMAYTQTA